MTYYETMNLSPSVGDSRVAVVIVDFNGLGDTSRCLDSLERINYQNYSIYLVDNGGSQPAELAALCAGYEKVNYLRSDENLGFSGGNNLALRVLDDAFDYVLLLNNDTVVTPNFLNRLIAVADENTLVGSKIYYWGEKERLWYAGGFSSRSLCKAWQSGFHKMESDFKDKGSRQVSFISGCCLLIPTKCLREVGLLEDSYFLYFEDTDYCFRALDAGFRLWYEADSVIFHCVSASAGHDTPLRNYYMIRNRRYFIDRFSTNKLVAKLLAGLEGVVGVLMGKYQMRTVRKAVTDYKAGITGRMPTD